MTDEAKVELTQADLDHAQQVGYNEGLEAGRKEILDFLETAYLNDPGRPDRGSAKAEAILEVAGAAAKYFRNKKKGRK